MRRHHQRDKMASSPTLRPSGASREKHHAGRPPHHRAAARSRRVGLSRHRGRHRDRGGFTSPDVRRGRSTRGPAGQRPAWPRGRRRPAGRDLHVEQRRAPRGLPHRPVHGRGPAHAQHPALPRAAHVHRQPCRGRGGLRRRAACSPPFARLLPTFETVRTRARRRAGGRRGRPVRDRVRGRRRRALRGAARRGRSGLRLARRRRARRRPRCATPPAPRATRRAWSTATARRACTRWRAPWRTSTGLRRARQRAARRADVPRQRLGAAVRGACMVGAELVLPGPADWTPRSLVEPDRGRAGHDVGAACRRSGSDCSRMLDQTRSDLSSLRPHPSAAAQRCRWR